MSGRRAPLNIYRGGLRGALGGSGRTLRAMRRAVNKHGADVLDINDEAVGAWSDLHLGHANIIAHQARPFRDVHEMNEALWTNRRLCVDSEDTVVVVGDFALGAALSEKTWERVGAAPGRSKVLVVGNHDITGQGLLRVGGFHRVNAPPISPGDPPVIWTHAPMPNVRPGTSTSTDTRTGA